MDETKGKDAKPKKTEEDKEEESEITQVEI